MRLTASIGSLTAFAAAAYAQDSSGDASDSDVQIVQAELWNVGNATLSLDRAVLNFSGPADTNNLQTASNAVLDALNFGTQNVQPIQGNITLSQGITYLLGPTNELNAVVTSAVSTLR